MYASNALLFWTFSLRGTEVDHTCMHRHSEERKNTCTSLTRNKPQTFGQTKEDEAEESAIDCAIAPSQDHAMRSTAAHWEGDNAWSYQTKPLEAIASRPSFLLLVLQYPEAKENSNKLNIVRHIHHPNER
jgi:hypothetical protein